MDNKYQRGKIYAIRSHQTEKQYIGSTCEPYLSKRLSGHRYMYQKHLSGDLPTVCTSIEILQFTDFYIELIELFPCSSKDELEAREKHYIRSLDNVVNRNQPTRTRSEYRRDNVDKIKEIKRIYRADPANRERERATQKRYMEENREEILERSRISHQLNKEVRNERCRQYKLDHKEELTEKKREYHVCECGQQYQHDHKARHFKSRLHIQLMANIENIVEII